MYVCTSDLVEVKERIAVNNNRILSSTTGKYNHVVVIRKEAKNVCIITQLTLKECCGYSSGTIPTVIKTQCQIENCV